jgi:nucleotide-binding universal stress UspA family protein
MTAERATVEGAGPTGSSSTFLVATDFSEASCRARDYAIALADRGDRLVLLHAHPLPLPDWPEPPYVPDWMPAGASVRGAQVERLRQFAAPARAAGLQVESVLQEGLAADVILGVAAALQPELIALGTGTRAAFGDWIMGSTAERVVRRALVPVLTVPAEAPPPGLGIRAVLCAVDAAEPATLDTARALAGRCDGALTILHVVDARNVAVPLAGRRREAELRLSAAVAGLPGPAPEVVVRAGRPVHEIVAAARERAVDLIVMGLRDPGRWPAELAHINSTAGRVMRESRCPVLTVPAGSWRRSHARGDRPAATM